MRIAHIVNRMDPSDGGPPAVVARLAAAQARAGHRVSVCANRPRDTAEQFRRAYGAIRGFESVPLTFFGSGRVGERLLGRAIRHELASLLAEHDFVHVHGMWQPLLLQATWQCRRAARPYCVTPHGMLCSWTMRQKTLKKRLALALAWRRSIDQAAFMQLVSDEESRQVAALKLRPPIVVVPNGVDLEELGAADGGGSRRPDDDALPERFVLFVGRLHYSKGLDVLCEAFALLARGDPGLELLIVGPDFGYGRALDGAIRERGLQSRVRVLGPVYGDEKLALMRRALCLCHPSRQEGFSVTVLEALASGLPVVISPPCGFDAVEAEGAGLVAPLDPREVAGRLAAICQDPARRRVMGEAATRMVRLSYTWDALSQRLSDAYAAAIEAGHEARPDPLHFVGGRS